MKQQSIAHRVTSDGKSVEWHYTTGQVEDLHLAEGQFGWVRGTFGLPYGICYLDKRAAIEGGICHTYEYMTDLRLTVKRTLCDAGYAEHYIWQNVGKKPIDIKDGEVDAYVTFAEKYDIRKVAVPYRAFTHILHAGSVCYIYNARMNGAKDGVGLVLQQGQVGQVVEERLHPAERGDIALTLPACTLQPEETREWRWLVFAYADEKAFWQVVSEYTHQIKLSALYPAAGQSVAVTVDGSMPATVRIDGNEQANPFVAPVGRFTLQPVENEDAVCMQMQGLPEVVHWANCYRHWGVGNANPRRHITACNLHLAEYDNGDKEGMARAIASLKSYYRTLGALARPQVGIPVRVLEKDEGLRIQFARHVDRVLRAKGRYTAQRVWATYRMLQLAVQVLGEGYLAALETAAQDAAPLFATPFGPLFQTE